MYQYLVHPLNANVSVLAASSRDRSADDLPLAGLVDQTITDRSSIGRILLTPVASSRVWISPFQLILLALRTQPHEGDEGSPCGQDDARQERDGWAAASASRLSRRRSFF